MNVVMRPFANSPGGTGAILLRTVFVFLFVFRAAPASGGMNPATLNFPRVTTVLGGGAYDNGNYSAMCVACHTRSPSANPAVTTLDNGSHFIFGGAGLSTDSSKYSLELLTVWPSGGRSKYGRPGANTNNVGTAGEMICESCHSMKYNAGKGKLLVLDNATSDPSALCEGCHSRTGPWHHVMTGEMSSLDGQPLSTLESLFVRASPVAQSEATYPAANAINCRSCHKPHDAQTRAGARILKRGYRDTDGGPVSGTGVTGLERSVDNGGNRVVTDFEPLCNGCHKASY